MIEVGLFIGVNVWGGGKRLKHLVSQLWDALSGRLVPAQEGVDREGPGFDIFREVDRARLDWLSARRYFDNVTDPELVDHAIFLVEAAEKKYTYLIRTAKRLGVALPSHRIPGILVPDDRSVGKHNRAQTPADTQAVQLTPGGCLVPVVGCGSPDVPKSEAAGTGGG
ncbi:MAG: YaaL family protein [Firmicutes bacterium]|nr:YaaL family protein [Bacillota bacterium]